MNVAVLTLLMFVVATTLGFVLSYAICKGWVPRAWLLQPGRQDWARFRERLPLIAANHTVLVGGSFLGLWYYGSFMTTGVPPLGTLLVQLAVVIFVEDLFFYFYHRALHESPFLYRHIHRIHHKAFAPLPLDHLYVQPLEWMLGTIGPLAGLATVYLAWGELNMWTYLVYGTFRELHELHIHSGLRSVLLYRVGLLSTVDRHDLHHARPNSGNYASSLRIWDRVFRTEAGR